MNIPSMTPAALERALSERLGKLLAGVGGLEEISIERNPAEFDKAFDLRASFKTSAGVVVELWVDIRRDPRPSLFPYVNVSREFEDKALKRVRVRVFAAPHVSPRLAELCEGRQWSWFDLSDNCHLRIPGLLHIHHTGNPPMHAAPKPKANLGTREAARVVRALLSPVFVGMTWTQRSLRINCRPQVSLGLVNKMVQHLQEEKYLERVPDDGFRVADPLKLLVAWREAYRFDQHERLGFFTLLQGSKLHEALASLDQSFEDHVAYAAFSAAEFQAPHVRQPKTWLYVSGHLVEEFPAKLGVKPVESGENLVVLVPSDSGVFFTPEVPMTEDRLPCTNLVQTYIDLWHSGGRGQEAAEALLEQCLKPVWRAAGYDV
ncbi:MAG: type IV toxin-antitoxin system AbiEi family antitoxin [Verrucomicrobiota bacterium]